MKLLKPLLIFYLIANGLAFSVFVARGTIVSWYVLEKTNSTLIVGLITSIPTMTLVTWGPLGGRLADSFPREKIFFYARIVILVVMVLLAMFINLSVSATRSCVVRFNLIRYLSAPGADMFGEAP